MNAIEIKDLTKNYGSFTIDRLSLSLPEGCIMGLIGENGAGKTTVIKSILGIIKTDGGNVRIFDNDICAADKNDIGVVLDEVGIPEMLNVKDIDLIMKNTFTNWDSGEFFNYIEKFSLPPKKKFKEYSKGMKMKLGIAVALSHNAKLLILDEPTSGLDPLARDEIIEILYEFSRDEHHSILISSHIVSDLEKLCDYIAFLHSGKITLCEEKDALLESYGFVNLTQQQFDELDPRSVKGKKITPYGVRAIVDRKLIPDSFGLSPVTIEDLFVFMSKEEK